MDEHNGKVVGLRGDPNRELRQARNWIARWRAVGGGFHVGLPKDKTNMHGLEVQIIRATDPDEKVEAAAAKAAGALEQELRRNTNLLAHVCALAKAHWTWREASKRAANDDTEEPANDEQPDPPAAA